LLVNKDNRVNKDLLEQKEMQDLRVMLDHLDRLVNQDQ
jgi:hypothetical protein